MLGRVYGLFCICASFFAILSGRTEALGSALLDGAQEAVRLTFVMVGAMCLWCGVMRVLSEAGAVRWLARMLQPLLRILFPLATRTGHGREEIAASLAANLLGLGNAATPLGIRAMQQMQRDAGRGEVSDDMICFTVLNTASITLLPTTLLSMRRAAGSVRPLQILVPTWICSAAGAVGAVLLCRLFAMLHRRGKR